MKRIAAGAGSAAVVTVGGSQVPRFSPVGRAQAAAPVLLAVGAGAIAGAVIGFAAGSYFGGADDEEILEARANELHDRVYVDATEMQMSQTPLLQSLQGDVNTIRQLCRADAAFEIFQAASDEAGESTATSNAKSKVEEIVADVEANFFDAWTAELTRLQTRRSLVESEGALSLDNVMKTNGHGGARPTAHFLDGSASDTSDNNVAGSFDISLIDGRSHSVDIVFGFPTNMSGTEYDYDNQFYYIPWSDGKDIGHEFPTEPGEYGTHLDSYESSDWSGGIGEAKYAVTVYQRDGSEAVDALYAPDWWKIHDSLLTLASEELTHVETMVSNLYQPAVDGEIDFAEIASGSALLEAAQDGGLETWREAEGIYRSMWMPESADPVVISLENGIEMEGRLFWTEPSEPLPVGESIDPEARVGRMYGALEIRHVPETDAGDMATVTVAVTDSNGDPVTDAQIDVKGGDTTHSVDSNGEAQIDVPAGHTTFYVTDEDGTTSETAYSAEVADGDEVPITHNGSDNSSFVGDPYADETLTPEDEGTALIPQLTDSFTITGVHEKPDATEVEFDVPQTVEPDDDFQTYQERAEDAGDKEEQTREETTIIIEESGGGGIPGTGDLMPDLSRILAGLFLIGGTIAVALGLASGD